MGIAGRTSSAVIRVKSTWFREEAIRVRSLFLEDGRGIEGMVIVVVVSLRRESRWRSNQSSDCVCGSLYSGQDLNLTSNRIPRQVCG